MSHPDGSTVSSFPDSATLHSGPATRRSGPVTPHLGPSAPTTAPSGSDGTGLRTEVGVSATVAGFDGVVLATVCRHSEAVASPPDRSKTVEVVDRAGVVDGVGVVAVDGDVDHDTAPLLLLALTESLDRHRRVRCDLSRTAFFAAAGANTVLAAHRHALATGSHLTLHGAHGTTLTVLTIVGLDRVLHLEP
jgi:anti-anti-sigma factor